MNAIPLFGPYALRRLRTEDVPDIFASIDTQRRHLGRWLPFVADTHQIEQTRQVVAGMLADTANPVYTIRDGETFAGLIGFKSADAGKRSIEIGYWLREEQQGKGIMTAAVRALCDLAFGEMGMRRVEIRCGTGNLPSNRIPQRLGFLRSHVEEQGEQLSDGAWIAAPDSSAKPARYGLMAYAAPGPTTTCPVRTVSHRKKEISSEVSFSSIAAVGPISS